MFSSNTSFVPSPVGSKHNHEKIKYEWDNLSFDDEDDANNYETSIDDILAPLEPIEDAWTHRTSEVSPPTASLCVSGLNIRSHSPITVPAKKESFLKSFQKESVVKGSFPIVKKEPKRSILNLKKAPTATLTKNGHFMKRRPRQIWSLAVSRFSLILVRFHFVAALTFLFTTGGQPSLGTVGYSDHECQIQGFQFL